MKVARRTRAPAYANLQRRKPRDVVRGSASDAMGILTLAVCCRSASKACLGNNHALAIDVGYLQRNQRRHREPYPVYPRATQTAGGPEPGRSRTFSRCGDITRSPCRRPLCKVRIKISNTRLAGLLELSYVGRDDGTAGNLNLFVLILSVASTSPVPRSTTCVSALIATASSINALPSAFSLPALASSPSALSCCVAAISCWVSAFACCLSALSNC